jgi:hypothetical protein
MAFDYHVGIDYSGAQTPSSRLPGLQVYRAGPDAPHRISASQSKSWNWTRQGIAQWLVELSKSGRRFIAGIDHGFSFPVDYFLRHKLESWPHFLEDFVCHWPTHEPHTYVDSFATATPVHLTARASPGSCG